MMRSSRFWTFMAVFQIAFGLAVFGLTRQFYLGGPSTPDGDVAAVPHAQQQWPDSGTQGGAQDDLANLIAAFPGPAVIQDPEEMLQRADAFFVNGDHQRAGSLYQQMLSAGFAGANVYNNLGLTLHYLGRSDEALAILQEGIALDSSYQRIWLTLGYVSSQAGRVDDARLALTTAVEMGADNEIGRSAAEMLQSLP